MAPQLTIQSIWKLIRTSKLKLFIYEWLLILLEPLIFVLMSFQVQYLVILTYCPNKYQTLSGLILVIVSESENTVEKGRYRWIIRLRWASLLCISSHRLWLGVVLHLLYPFNAKRSPIKYWLHWISLDPLVFGFLFLQWIITEGNPTKGPGFRIGSIIYWYLPRHYWPVRWNTTIYSLIIDLIFDCSTSTISICNSHQATYPPGSYIISLGDSCNLWLNWIRNHVWRKGRIWKRVERYSFHSQGWGSLQGNCDWFYYIMIRKQPWGGMNCQRLIFVK